MKKIISNWDKILLIVVVIIIVLFYSLSFYNQEKEYYESYADYTRADIVMTLTYNKEFQFYSTRYVQSFNTDEKITEGDLIYDFAQYEYLPILNYLVIPSENKALINSFYNFLEFFSDYYVLTVGSRENIFVRQHTGKYYTFKNDIYTYYVKMNVIGKKGLNTVYNEYLNSKNYKNVEENFLKSLYSLEVIKNEYSYHEICNLIQNNDLDFYSRNENEILEVIVSDMNSFINYLYTYYIFLDKTNNDELVLLKEIETDLLELTFNLEEGDRIYKSASKYYTHSYILDINNVWQQLEEKGYPKIYS